MSLEQGFIGQWSLVMLLLLWNGVINIRNLHQSLNNPLPSSSSYLLRGHLPSRGVDILDLYPKAMGNRKFILVGVDDFTKCVEVEALVVITVNKVISFLWKNIICRFRILKVLIINNRTEFDNHKMKEQCQKLHINHWFSSVSHP
jgi:hypothetical protein